MRQLINQAHTTTTAPGVQATPYGTVRFQGEEGEREVYMIVQINLSKINSNAEPHPLLIVERMETRTRNRISYGSWSKWRTTRV